MPPKKATSFRLSSLAHRQLDELAQVTGMNEVEVVEIALDRFWRSQIITNEQLHEMARSALDNWDFESADEPYSKAKPGLEHILAHDYDLDVIFAHLKTTHDWDGLQDWAVYIAGELAR